jgi:hypothetical protein
VHPVFGPSPYPPRNKSVAGESDRRKADALNVRYGGGCVRTRGVRGVPTSATRGLPPALEVLR